MEEPSGGAPINLSKAEARRFLVRYHGLDGAAGWTGKAGILSCFERLGAIQYDPLDVVGRNPDLVLQSRIAGYRRNQINELLYHERLLVDQWDKQMSIHLTAEWPQRARLRHAYAEMVRRWLRHYRNSEAALNHLEQVREALAQSGPVLPARLDFGTVPNHSGWGSRKVAGAVLDYLAAAGEAGIHSRRNTQKVYDLIGKLLPGELLAGTDPFPDEHEFLLWYARRRVEAVGLAANRNGGTWLVNLLDSTRSRSPLLEELVQRGSLLQVAVEGVKERLYLPAAYRHLLAAPAEEAAPAVRFLAPLDNMLFDRKLVTALFDFEYSWEVYVPAAKRRYGYYVLPVLYGDRLIGRLEPAVHRGGPLEIRNWWWEPGVRRTPELRRAVVAEQKRFREFLAGA